MGERLLACDVLKLVRRQLRMKFRELTERTGFPAPDLSKYVSGRILPSEERAQRILEVFPPEWVARTVLRERCRVDQRGFVDNSVLLTDVDLLRVLAAVAQRQLDGERVTKVLTAAVDGVPLAAMAADRLDAGLVVAKFGREVGIDDYLEASVYYGRSGVVRTLYVPRGQLEEGDRVLIVDDLIRSGETQCTLASLVRRAGSQLVAIFTPLIVGREWKSRPEFQGRYRLIGLHAIAAPEPPVGGRRSLRS